MVTRITKETEARIKKGQSLADLCNGRIGNRLSAKPTSFKPSLWETTAQETESSVLNFGLTLIDRGYTADQAARRLANETPRSSHNDMNRWREVLALYKRSKIAKKLT